LTVLALDHLQLAMPPDGEAEARAFYGRLLGLPERAKPASLQAWGGVWFVCGEHEVHLGVEADFRPARKAHPAFRVAELDLLRSRLLAAGRPVVDDTTLPEVRRLFTEDPFGNRIELIERPAPPD
jgi:catechol 2,3-dioxygenase-like lactoylglutathione lyase family enzyme